MLPASTAKQCRLAGAVAADQPEPLAGLYGELRVIEERPLAEGDWALRSVIRDMDRIVRIGRAMGKSPDRRRCGQRRLRAALDC